MHTAYYTCRRGFRRVLLEQVVLVREGCVSLCRSIQTLAGYDYLHQDSHQATHTLLTGQQRGVSTFCFAVGSTCTGRMRKSRSRRPRHGFCRSHAVRNAAKDRLSRSKLVRRSLARSKLFTYSEYICEPLDLFRCIRSIRLESSVRYAVGTTRWLDSVAEIS